MALTNEYQYIGRSNALTSSSGHKYYILLYAKTVGDITTGAHTVSVKMRMACTTDSYFYAWSTSGYTTVNGIDAIRWAGALVPNAVWSTNLTEGGVTYPRWIDLKEGTVLVSVGYGKTTDVAMEASWVLDYGEATWLPPFGEYAKVSTTVTLPSIEGPTVPVMGASSVELGKSVTIQTTALLDGCTHKLSYSIGSASGVIAEDVAASCTWTPLLDLAKQIPNATNGTAVITCTTYRNGEQFGTPQQTTVLLVVPDTVVPTASATWVDTSGAFDALGVYAKGVSKLAVDVAGTGAYGSTITGASMTLGGKAYAGGVITSTGALELVVTVKDSRGRSGSASYTVNVADYAAPTLTLNVSRCTEDGTADDMGEYAQVTVTGYVSPVGENTASLKLTYGTTTETVELATGEISYSKIISAPSTSTMKIGATMSDALFSAPASMILSVGYATMDFLEGGKGIAFGTTAQEEGFECAMPARFTGGVHVGGSPVADFVTEEGTSGYWKYRKWNSGTVEAWSMYSSFNLGSGTVFGSYGYLHTASYNLPDGLFSAKPPFGLVNCDIPAAANYVAWKSSASEAVVWIFTTQEYSSSNNTTLNVYLRS